MFLPMWLACAPSFAATWVVDPTGGGDALTVKDGVALLEDGDRLEIRGGTFYEDRIVVQVEDVEIVGDGWDVTIISGSGSATYGMEIIGGNELSGISFTGYSGYAVAVYNRNENAATIDIHDIAVWQSDRGVFTEITDPSTVVVTSSYFGDITTAGVSTYTFDGELLVEGCIFRDSSVAVLFGSGYDDAMGRDSTVTVVGNTMVSSRLVKTYTDSVGYAYAYNNIIAGSMTSTWSIDSNTSGEIANNLVGSDITASAINHSSTMDDSTNLSGDPMFVDRTDDGDATNDDLRLLLGSAAIDVGVEGYATLTTDLDGTTRPVDGDDDGTALPDVGAYEFVRVDEDGDGELADTVGGGDCDDTDPTVLPGAEEICGDGVDQDCDELDPTCPEDTGLPDSGTPPDTGSPADSAAPADTAAPTDTGPPEDTATPQETGHPPGQGDSGDSLDGAQLANHGPASRCGCGGQRALLLWPAMWLIARRRRPAQARP